MKKVDINQFLLSMGQLMEYTILTTKMLVLWILVSLLLVIPFSWYRLKYYTIKIFSGKQKADKAIQKDKDAFMKDEENSGMAKELCNTIFDGIN